MTVSLRTRVLGVLNRAKRKYTGHRTLDSVIATVETLLRQRGDVNDSAVRVADLDGMLEQFLEYHLETSGHAPGSGGGGGGVADHGGLSGLADDDHPHYLNNARGDTRYPKRTDIDVRFAFRSALTTGYKEFTYTGSKLTQIDIWTNGSKVTKLFTRVFSYTGNDLTLLVTTDEQTGLVLTKSFSYTGGKVTSMSEAIA